MGLAVPGRPIGPWPRRNGAPRSCSAGCCPLVGCGLDLDTHSGQAQHKQRPAQAHPASYLADHAAPLKAVSILPASQPGTSCRRPSPDGIGPSPAPAFRFLVRGCLSPPQHRSPVPTVLTAGPCIGSSYRRRVGGKEDAHGIVCGANKYLEFPWDDVNENSRVFQKFRIQRSRPPTPSWPAAGAPRWNPPGNSVFSTSWGY